MGKQQSKFGVSDAMKNSNMLPGMICFPARLRRANSVDSFVVPLLPATQSVMSLASANGRSLSLESLPLMDTIPLLRAQEQPSVASFTRPSKNHEPSDTNTSSSTESSFSDVETDSTIQESHQVSQPQNNSPFFNLSEQEWKEVVDFVCSRVQCSLRKALLDYRTRQQQPPPASADKPTGVDVRKSSERKHSNSMQKRTTTHRKLQMDDDDVRQFDELLQERLQQISRSCFHNTGDVLRDDMKPQKRIAHHCSAPLTPHLSRKRKEWHFARSKSEEDASRCGKLSDNDFQTRLEEIAKQCDSRGIRGKGAAMMETTQTSQEVTQLRPPSFTPKKHRKGQRRGHSKSLADIDNNAPGIPENRIHENRQKSKARWKSHSMGRDKYPNGRPFVVRHREAEIQPVVHDTLQVQQEVHYYHHKHIEVGESTGNLTSLQSATTCNKLFGHSRATGGAHHDCSCHPVHSGRLSPQTDMAVFNLDVERLDHQRLVRHWHRHDHHHFHIVHVSKRTQV